MILADHLADIYLGLQLLTGSSGTSNPNKFESDTALHSGKDLAVSLSMFPSRFTLSIKKSGASFFRQKRHCSHLYSYLRRALPATFLTLNSG